MFFKRATQILKVVEKSTGASANKLNHAILTLQLFQDY
jgi:hypothetical protein